MYKVRILTCYCGEPSFKILAKRLKRQKNVLIDQHVIENLSLADANSEFYKCLLNTNSAFDFVIKLDADMLPKSDLSIFNACKIADSLGKIRLTLPVLDLYTKSSIFGIHIISNKVNYSQHKRETTPKNDRWIKEIEGSALWHSKNLLFYHGVMPSEIQLFRFGYQRGKKLVNKYSDHPHWQTAQIIHKNFKYKSTNKNKIIFAGLLVGLDQIKDLNKKLFILEKPANNFLELKTQLEKKRIKSQILDMKKRSFLYPKKLSFFAKTNFLISLLKQIFTREILSCLGNFKYQRIINKTKSE